MQFTRRAAPIIAVLPVVLAVFFLASCSQKKDPITYCGEREADGAWADCNPDRYNVPGPAERLLDKGVSRIIMIDLTVGGVRFAKTLDVVRMTRRAMVAWERRQAESQDPVAAAAEKVGVIFIVHGGFDRYRPQYLWDASTQMFSYDPNHPVHLLYIWNEAMWGNILQSGNAAKEVYKYAFEYERIGGTDPFNELTRIQLLDMQAGLDTLGAQNGLEFEVDWAAWMAGDNASHYPFPRYLYDPDTNYGTAAEEPSTPLVWINDYTGLMERSYPAEPEGWTRSLGLPGTDRSVPLESGPNPVAADPALAALHVAAIEAGISDAVADNRTAVMLLNHAIHDHNEVFDPKIDDTLVLNKNIKKLMLERHPDMDPDNIIGAYMGIKELNEENGKVERTREMRGENLGSAWLYESDKELPGGEWGYRYWDALEYLKNRGVRHIIIGFPQIITDSVLNLVEIHNQIAKEIGVKTWLYYAQDNTGMYPDTGHPFAEYWGMWVETECDGGECCFEMGGCEDGRPYPPPRQTPLYSSRGDDDPSLAYDLCEYGHLGYDPLLGPPDPDAAVQDQYTGTWALYRPPNDDPAVGSLLARHVLNAALGTLE